MYENVKKGERQQNKMQKKKRINCSCVGSCQLPYMKQVYRKNKVDETENI